MATQLSPSMLQPQICKGLADTKPGGEPGALGRGRERERETDRERARGRERREKRLVRERTTEGDQGVLGIWPHVSSLSAGCEYVMRLSAPVRANPRAQADPINPKPSTPKPLNP